VSGDPYVYPGTTVLQNKFDIRDADQLDKVERRFVTARLEQGPPTGGFNLDHLRAIHRHLFQDVYAWAGEIRTVEIAKGGNHFQHRRFIETGMADVHGRLVKADFLRGMNRPLGRPPGKRSDPAWKQYSVLLRRDTQREAANIQRDRGEGDFSALIQSLVEEWLKKQRP